MLSRLVILPLLSAFALLLASCVSPPAAQRNPATVQRSQSLATLGYSPIELQKFPGDARYSGEFLVNGAPVRFLIDSGANSTDLDARLSKKLGIKTDNSIEVVSRGALGRPVSARVGLGSLTAGSVTASPFPFMIAPHTDRQTATSRYDGQLGLDALSGLGALIDLSNGLMWVPSHRSHMTPGSPIRPLGRHKGLAFDTLPLRRTGKLPHLHVKSTWGKHELTWVVDTGAEVTVLAQETADKLGIPTQASRSRIIDASGDQAKVGIAVLDAVVFNRLVISKFQVAVIPLGKVQRTFRDSRGRPIDGIIGMDFLEETSALLDSSSRLLYVGPPGAAPNVVLE